MRVAPLAVVAAVAALAGDAGVSSQELRQAASSISGRVVLEGDGDVPIRRVTVTITGGNLAAGRLAITDEAGLFRFDRLPAGRYQITAARAGYVRGAFAAMRGWRSNGRPIVLADDQHVSGITVSILRGAVLTGRVSDQHGRPLAGAQVHVGELRVVAGVLRLTDATARTVTTDDRGVYRAFGLPPGRFVVAVRQEPPGRRLITAPAFDEGPYVGYAPAFYPGTPDPASAEAIVLAPGEERAGLDLTIRPSRMTMIKGTVRAPAGAPGARAIIHVAEARRVEGSLRGTMMTRIAGTAPDGSFVLENVPPGTHELLAVAGDAAGSFWARSTVRAEGPTIEGLELALQPAIALRGRLVVDGRPDLPPPEALRKVVIRLRAVDTVGPGRPPGPGTIGADGAFTLSAIVPGPYVFHAENVPAGWMVLAATAGGVDLLADVLDVAPGSAGGEIVVTLTDRVTEISGRLLNEAGAPAPQHVLLVFPADRRVWALGQSRLPAPIHPGADGRYSITGLPPGNYHLAALTDLAPGDHLDPDFLDLVVPGAIPLSVAAGEHVVQAIRIVGR